ncbi:hypothetical protein [Mesorhizobium sp. LjRoot246]|uniref:hypothetical protein n=1 Tax=Mesorhizobium sp. LjRoot246 TaxID=3342294 RepID=UPI003ECC50E6
MNPLALSFSFPQAPGGRIRAPWLTAHKRRRPFGLAIFAAQKWKYRPFGSTVEFFHSPDCPGNIAVPAVFVRGD